MRRGESSEPAWLSLVATVVQALPSSGNLDVVAGDEAVVERCGRAVVAAPDDAGDFVARGNSICAQPWPRSLLIQLWSLP